MGFRVFRPDGTPVFRFLPTRVAYFLSDQGLQTFIEAARRNLHRRGLLPADKNRSGEEQEPAGGSCLLGWQRC